MKTISFFIIGLSLLTFRTSGLCNTTDGNKTGFQSYDSSANTLNIASSPEMNGLVTNWINEYFKVNSSLSITLSNLDDHQTSGSKRLNIVSNDNSMYLNEETTWKMIIGRNAIVPIISTKNPILDEIFKRGLSVAEFTKILTQPKIQNWSTFINHGVNANIHCFLSNNEELRLCLAKFTKTDPHNYIGTKGISPEELIKEIKKDVFAIGFCKLSDICDASTNELKSGICILPIDKNMNGKIDNLENIYSNLNTFTRGVWIGKYPKSLCVNIYASSASKPSDANSIAFLNWVNSEGQQYLNPNGYCVLSSKDKQANMDALNPSIQSPRSNSPLFSSIWILVLFSLIVAGMIIYQGIKFILNKKSNELNSIINVNPVLEENSIIAPKGLYFDRTHTWAFLERDGSVRIGIDDFLQRITGQLTKIKMKEPGEKIRKGEQILTIIRNGKQLHIYAPISGIIKEQNPTILSDSSIINSSPYFEGWVYLIEPKNWAREIQLLFMAEQYLAWIKDEFSRLKDFLIESSKENTIHYQPTILQDGGELSEHVLADLGPEIWEDFQTEFIDTSK